MNKLMLISIATAMLFFSCDSVKFEVSQPKGDEELKVFPSNLIGTYINSDNDTLIIDKNTYKCGKKKSIFYLSDTISTRKTVFKKYNDYFVLSTRDNKNENIWEVVTVKLNGKNLMLYYIGLDKKIRDEVIKKLKEILSVKEIKNSNGTIDYYLINPTKDEFDALLKKEIFAKIGDFKKIK